MQGRRLRSAGCRLQSASVQLQSSRADEHRDGRANVQYDTAAYMYTVDDVARLATPVRCGGRWSFGAAASAAAASLTTAV